MKLTVLPVATFCVVILAAPVSAANPNANWRELIEEAYTKADLVMSGTVQSVDDQTAVDGGHVYSLQVTGQQKGAPQKQVLVRAGGFFYQVILEKGDSVTVFLKSRAGGNADRRGAPAGQGKVYSLVEAASLRPMVFKVAGNEARPVDQRLKAEFADVSADEVEDFLSSIQP